MKCPHCLKEIRKSSYEINRINRLNLILSVIDKSKTIDSVYRSIRIKGYPYGRKTLTRDLKQLKEINKINMKIKPKKDGGFKTFIYKLYNINK